MTSSVTDRHPGPDPGSTFLLRGCRWKKRWIPAFAGMTMMWAISATAQTIAITGGTVALGDGSEPIPNGTVVIRNGRIAGAGINVPIPQNAQMIDARGKWVTPGIVAGFSRLGLSEVDLSGGLSDDRAVRSPWTSTAGG